MRFLNPSIADISPEPRKVKRGRETKIPRSDRIKPPIVPAANGNQKASLSAPNKKGTKPKIVERMVSKIGVIFAFQAFK